MSDPMHLAMLTSIATGFLCLVFVRALLHKISSFEEHIGTVRDYRVVSNARLAGIAVVVAEALTVAGLLWPTTRAAATVLAIALLMLYSGAIAINLLRGRTTIDCGCGGGGQGISPLHVVRNLVLIAIAAPLVLLDSAMPIQLSASFAVVGCVLVLWLTFLAFDQLLGNRMHAIASVHSIL